MGIEPTGDDTRLPDGFEDRGGHQLRNQPQIRTISYYNGNRGRLAIITFIQSLDNYFYIG